MLTASNGSDPLGAYGFRLILEDGPRPLPGLLPVAGDEIDVGVRLTAACGIEEFEDIRHGYVFVTSRRGIGLITRADPPHIELMSPVAPTAEGLVHPLLTAPLAMLARWRGDTTLHGGAFFHAGAAWGLMGERTAGKSSMLALLGERGVPIVADDLVVIDDGWVRAGPSCVDLRPDVGRHVPSAKDIGIVGTRHRLRLTTPPAPSRSRLGGLFVMEWHDADEPQVVAMTTAERLQLLYRQEAVAMLGFVPPEKLWEMLEVPMWRFRRKRDWEATPAAVDRLLEATETQAP